MSDEKEQGAGGREQGKQPRDFNMLTAKILRAMDIGTYKS